MKHLLDFQNVEKENLEKIINAILKLNIQKLKKIDSFTLLQFNESSTRTRLSFSIAAQKLGINVVESQDSISAKEKGEVLVIRTKENNLEEYRNFDEISVISGGFGNTSHPTQALVDVATLTKLNKFSYEVPVTYVGDLKHSRVFSSGRELLTKLGFKVGVFSNEELLPSNLDNLCVFDSWEEVVENSGSVELLRVQKERIENIEGFDFNNYKKNFQLTNEILENTSDDFVVLHPMPINVGIEIDDNAANNKKFIYQEQLKMAIPARVASYQYVFGAI
jgi:aspartate carbamoyltransferase catalytic subunit